MTVAIGTDHLQDFRDLVAHRLGLHFEDARLTQLAEVFEKRLAASRQSPEVYLSRLRSGELSQAEIPVLARDLTVGETYFFRNTDQLRAFEQVAVPDRMRAKSESHRLLILSAGCASGEEPYTLAILLMERLTDPAWTAAIRAVDVNPAALAKARLAHYSAWALRDTAAQTRSRWFRPQAGNMVLTDAPRRLVTFEERNLAEPSSDLWKPGAYDIVFCRNVLMYFTTEGAVALVSRIASALAPGGFLFLGHAETLRGLSQEFHLRHTHETFYYQRRETPLSAGASSPLATADDTWRETKGALPALEEGVTWIEAIRRASQRIHALADAAKESRGSAPHEARGQPPRWDLASVVDLLKAERFGEALERVHELPREAAMDPDVLLLRATLLTHSGQLAEAERACNALLEVDELNAGAHYLLALCHEGRHDSSAAIQEDQLSAHLDPSFAMPRLHQGLLARRAGNTVLARRELSQALELLRREDAARVLLFGGGFSRDALSALCRAELAATSGAT